MEFNNLVKKRRTIRSFVEDYYVTDEELKEIFEAVRYAPSWANTQVWEFIVIRDKKKIKKITDTYSEKNPARTCSYSASVLIMACIKKEVAGYRDGEARTSLGEWGMFDLGSAVQNLSLRAYELGLGSVIVGSFKHKKCEEILEIPKEYQLLVAIPMGKLKKIPEKSPFRRAISDFLHYDEF